MIYTVKQDSMAGVGHAQAVAMKLLDSLDGRYRTVVADNFFTSISLAKYLLEHAEVIVLDQVLKFLKIILFVDFMIKMEKTTMMS